VWETSLVYPGKEMTISWRKRGFEESNNGRLQKKKSKDTDKTFYEN